MQEKESCRKKNLLGKLSLRKQDSQSSQTQSSQNEFVTIKEDQEKADDSLSDFKSPKEKVSSNPKLMLKKLKGNGVKKKILGATRKPSDNKQPKIESSFFKAPLPPAAADSNSREVKNAVPCPVCTKPFKDDKACTAHMKSCAAKNGVSFQQLMQAKELQDRQAEERKAMGLLAAPILQDRKRVTRAKRNNDELDPHLALAKALSESQYEAEQNQFEEQALLAGIPEITVKEMIEEDRKKTLTKFGFTTNKQPSEEVTHSRSKKSTIRRKKLLGPTILESRSKEDKDRVVTERIACILTGDDALTQTQTLNKSLKNTSPTILKSSTLQEIQNKTSVLWEQSRLTRNKVNFYVEDLKSHFMSTKEDEPSQPLEQLSVESVTYEPMEVVATNEQNSVIDEPETSSTEYKVDYSDIITANWREALNNSAASDIVVFLKDEQAIFCHKLVFFVQCSEILLHIDTNDTGRFPNIKEKICWPTVDKKAALGFLEFIYCGSIIKWAKDLEGDDSLAAQIRDLARTYKVKDLFSYLRKSQRQERPIVEKVESHCIENNIFLKDQDELEIMAVENRSMEKSLSLKEESFRNNDSLKKYKSESFVQSKNENESKEIRNNWMENYRRHTVSPDLFGSDEENDDVQKNESNEEIEPQKNESNKESELQTNESNEEIESQKNESYEEIGHPITCTNKTDTDTQLNVLINLINEDPDLKSKTNYETLDMSLTNDLGMSFLRNECKKSGEVQEENAKIDTLEGEKIVKKKSEISLFIDKMKRQNERSIMASDSEVETPVAVRSAKPRNPFLKKLREDNPYAYLYKDNKKSPIRRKGISLLEEDVLKNKNNDPISEDKSMEIDDQNLRENSEMEEENFDDTTDEADMSRYSKYKKNNKDNSISKYREALRNEDSAEEVTLISDSEDEKNNEPPHLEGEASPITSQILVEDKVIELSDSNSSSREQFPTQNRPLSDELKNSVFDDFLGDDSDPEINKILRSSQECSEEVERVLQECQRIGNLSQNVTKSPDRTAKSNTVILLSPISISSSPETTVVLSKTINSETSHNEMEINNDLETERNIPETNRDFEMEAIEIDNDSEAEIITPEINRDFEMGTVEITNDSETEKNTPEMNRDFEMGALINSPILAGQTQDFPLDRHKFTKPQETRKMKNKSVSERQLKKIDERRNLLQRSSSFATPPQTGTNLEFTYSVTPPLDYSAMGSPDLRNELKKFGLKPQSKGRAKQILRHIYDEMHPVVPVSQKRATTSSDDEENGPPQKKQNVKLSQKLSQKSRQNNCIIPEEMDFDGPNSQNDVNPGLNIKEAFEKLMKADKELSTKVLTYKPLHLEDVYKTFRKQGVKLKMNDLMDFLDEQCITFQVPGKGTHQTKKRTKNK